MDQWIFVAITYRDEDPAGSRAQIAINGFPVHEGPLQRVETADETYSAVGGQDGDFGGIDELLVLRRALSETEIKQLYQLGRNGVSLGADEALEFLRALPPTAPSAQGTNIAPGAAEGRD